MEIKKLFHKSVQAMKCSSSINRVAECIVTYT